MMSKIRYRGHSEYGRIPASKNPVYNRLIDIIKSNPIFTELNYNNDLLVEEFKIEWKQNIKQELEKHILVVEYNIVDISIHNMVRMYNTNICEGKVFVKSYIVPKVTDKNTVNKKIMKNDRFAFQVNLEVGVYINDGYESIVLEDLYCTS